MWARALDTQSLRLLEDRGLYYPKSLAEKELSDFSPL